MSANSPTETTALSSAVGDPLHQFTAAFGDNHAAMLKEIYEYWKEGGSPFPIEVYEHLLKARVDDGRIDENVAKELQAYFKASFAEDRVTGYFEKHREPLINALTQEYIKHQDLPPLMLVEGDFMNLAGLNKALSEEYANKVIRHITDMVKRHFKDKFNVAAVRHGGDEIRLWIQPKNSDATLEADVTATIENTQKEIAEFVTACGLDTIIHTKRDDKGAGIGLASTLLRDKAKIKSNVDLRMELEEGILANKELFYKEIKLSKNTVLDWVKLEERVPKRSHVHQAERTPKYDKEFHGTTPEESRLKQLKHLIKEKKGSPLTAEEIRIVDATHKLTAKLDPVNGLPLVLDASDMEETILPHFKQRHGDQLTLVHFDFSNLGGGNTLGSWVADAMSRKFVECIKAGLLEEGLREYTPYLTSSGGGKFDLLLPPTEPEGSKGTIRTLRNAIQRKFDACLDEKLDIGENGEFDATKRIVEKLNKERAEQVKLFAEAQALGTLIPETSSPSRRQPMPQIVFKKKGEITVGDIINNKTRRRGVYFNVISTKLDTKTQDLAAVMESLKIEAEKDHKAEDGRGIFRGRAKSGLKSNPEIIYYNIENSLKSEDSPKSATIHRTRRDKMLADILEKGTGKRKDVKAIKDPNSPNGKRIILIKSDDTSRQR